MILAEHVARMEEARNEQSILVGVSKGKGPLGKLKCRWRNNIEMDLK
jgi:hypothetical protein